MASRLNLFCLQLLISFLLLLGKNLANAEPQVPCYFIFGDSLSDSGNNNFLNTSAKVNYRPYGIDFPRGVPTGRFCNGEHMQDFIVKHLGFRSYIIPFKKAIGKSTILILEGVNYASGAAGILDESGRTQGERISMNQQLRYHKIIVSKIRLKLGNSRAKTLLSQCIYSLQIGSNDYLNNYFLPQFYNTSSQYTPEEFAELLVDKYSKQIKSLYDEGARKMAIYGVGTLGFIPITLAACGNNASCTAELNRNSALFNDKLKPVIQQLNANLTDAKFTYLNPAPTEADIAASGFTILGEPCCKIGGGGGELCVRNSRPCNNRTQYIFWDGAHPTKAWNNLTAGIAFASQSSSDADPFNIQELAQQ